MKILFHADTHIKLGQKSVPKEWQTSRYLELAERLDREFHSNGCDLHVIGGDLMDTSDPSTEEIKLMFAFLSRLNHKGIIYTGNHELVSKKTSCLEHLSEAIHDATAGKWTVVGDYRSEEFDIIPYTSLHNKTWKAAVSKLCFTHVRGEIPPHVKPEIDLERFVDHGYSRVIAGDLHSFKNTQTISGTVDLIYPGSPLTTSFHRERTKGTNGALVVDTMDSEVQWIELGDLPQLVRKTIEAGEEMVADPYDRVIYEVTGDVSQLKAIKGSDLLDKRLNNKVTKDAKLDLKDTGLIDEIVIYLKEVQKLPQEAIDRIIKRAAEYVEDSN